MKTLSLADEDVFVLGDRYKRLRISNSSEFQFRPQVTESAFKSNIIILGKVLYIKLVFNIITNGKVSLYYFVELVQLTIE